MSMSGYGLLAGVCAGVGVDVDVGMEVGVDVVNDGGAVACGDEKHDAKFDADADVTPAILSPLLPGPSCFRGYFWAGTTPH